MEESHTDCSKSVRLLIYHPRLTQAEREKMDEQARGGGTVIKVFADVPEPDTPEEETGEHKEKN